MTEILIENGQEKEEITEEITEAIKAVILKTLEYEECNFDAEVSVSIVDNAEIREINNAERGIGSATDVLSFPMLEFDEEGNVLDCEYDYIDDNDVILLGDIVISAERAREQAEEYGHSFKREMAFLTVHSMLHLLGYDHVDDPEGEAVMIRKQKEILNLLNITREV